MGTLKQLFFEEVNIGTEITASVDKINLLRLMRYAAATWNFFLIHIDKEFARKQGFKDANIPAPLYGAFLAKMMTNWIAPRGRLKTLGYRVTVMGFPGDTLICKGKVAKKYQQAGENLVDCDIWVENQEGEKVAPASATVSLPSRGV
jgi:acyl dehydratase